ncbi:hypothetical protein [Psychroserpens sp.]|uniref:hypothetical protein n=1 Tax=Psychroserpens sp. TaxID=2020870 RepID=UPI001B132C01|nr:hypothetical protein [Psychroserpens sp.]MBO6608014.1 hypothetical protein [Psychroserpens sp.]MBO6632176.1 hypothetical protein [Psychroserpens sp.]MBO6654859.1 hypothetical protein [Psychroserpens sp.]MBO6683067.1 hypothetical protein [Psychroserpens sp.]MBO6751372.1 hypothetical protein [Psychroserpens sp.]
MLRSGILVVLLTLLVSCESDKNDIFLLPANANRLIAGEHSKTWKLATRYNNNIRMNMGDCFLSYRVTYSRVMNITDNNSEHEDCGESLNAIWSTYENDEGQAFIKLKGPKVKALLNQDNDYKFFKLLALDSTLMVVEFKHAQYGSKATKIIDSLVPEHIKVDGRKFHW